MGNNEGRAVFLDRDGCVIVEKKYLSNPAEVELIPGAGKALAKLKDAGFRIVIITNQSGVARGYFTEKDVMAVNDRLSTMLFGEGVTVDGIYYSPYHPEATVEKYRKDSECRKPRPGMLQKAAADLDIDLENSFMIGDKVSDLECAETVKASGILVLTGYGEKSRAVRPDARCFPSVVEAAEWILGACS
ncbi:MAG: HAD family hydrolase [Planctomycetes bacterium]|nr:HAD family hydrolase [Planctomycetota bacterium]